MWLWNLNKPALIALAALALLAAGAYALRGAPPASAHHLCANTGSVYGPFDIQTYEAADYRNTYARTLELAGFNQLFPEIPSFALPDLETGGREAGSGTRQPGYVPPVILKAIAYIESNWAQASFSPLVDYGETGPVLVSHDCGYGLMQVTTGMQNISGIPNLEQAMIGAHYAFNVARGARILADKWNQSPETRPVIGERDPALIENWYYAVWGYNGWAFSNHPLNPSYSPGRVPFSCGATNDGFGHDRTQYPYQEVVLGCVQRPPSRLGTPLWTPQEVHLPDLADPKFAGPLSVTNWNACTYSAQCQAMDIPTPNTYHQDPTQVTVSREQVIGQPAMSVSASALTLSVPGAGASTGVFQVSNVGTGVLGFRATSSVPWLKVSPAAGVALGADLGSKPGQVQISTTAAAPPGGQAQVKVESLLGGSRTVQVSVSGVPTEGAIITGSGPEVYYYTDGLRRHIPSLATFSYLGLDWSQVQRIPDSALLSIPPGDPLLDIAADGRLLAGSGPEVYVMDGGFRRHVMSVDAMSRCGFSFGAVTTVQDALLSSLPLGPGLAGPPCPLFRPTDGRLFASGPAVYVIRDGLRRHVPSLLTMEARGYRFGNVNKVSEGLLTSIPLGNPLPDVGASGNLVRASGRAEVFVLEGGVKRHVVSLEAMAACGYGFDAVTVLSAPTVDAIPQGAGVGGPPCPAVRYPKGTLVAGSGPAVYVIDGSGARRHVASLDAFSACGYRWGNVDVIADSLLNSIPTGPPVSSLPCP